jgi:hypothetical protein
VTKGVIVEMGEPRFDELYWLWQIAASLTPSRTALGSDEERNTCVGLIESRSMLGVIKQIFMLWYIC